MTEIPGHPALRTVTGTSEPPDDELSLLGFANVLLRHRHLIGGLVLTAVAVTVAVVLAWPRSYTVSSTFMPQTRKPPSSIAGLASQFGISLGSLDVGQGPAFYVDLVTSREVLGAAVDTVYQFKEGARTVSGTLVQIFESKGETPALRRDAAIRRLEHLVSAAAVQRTGVVNLEVRLRNPVLAFEVNGRLIDLLNRFNMQTRQTQASAERRFAEARVKDAAAELHDAESRQEAFLTRNREYRNSPELVIQLERLTQDVSMQRTLFTSLSQMYEQARLEEVRDTPVLTIVQPPEIPVRPDRRGLALKTFIVAVLATLLGIGIAFSREMFSGGRQRLSSEAVEFETLRREALGELLHPLRRRVRQAAGA
jgi:uncharacterized protein involved in exopolysaccharide biosynthesis